MADAIDAPERRFVQNKYGKASVVSNLTQWDQIVFEVTELSKNKSEIFYFIKHLSMNPW